MDTLGIDIGTVSVKYVRAHGKGQKAAMVSRGIYPYSGELPHLETILTDIRIKEGSHRVAIGISSQDILKKSVTIPILPKEEKREALNWSVSKTIATPMEEMICDYIMLGEVEERGIRKEEACFVGVQREFVENLLGTFGKSGFREAVLITDIGFVYKEVVDEGQSGATAVIDVGGTQSGLYVFEGKKMRLVRELLIAAESFSDALVSGLTVRSPSGGGVRDEGFGPGTAVLSDMAFTKLAGEIQRTFTVFEKRYPGIPLKKIRVTGRGAEIPGFMERLKAEFGETVEALQPVRAVEPVFLPAFLLALYPERLVNLLPEDVKQKEREGLYRKWVLYGSGAVAAALALLSLNMATGLNRLHVAAQLERASVARLKQEAHLLSRPSMSGRSGAVLPSLNEIERKDATFITLLKYLSFRIPAGVCLTSIRFGMPAASGELSGTGVGPVPAPPPSTSSRPQAGKEGVKAPPRWSRGTWRSS